tara:strand:- start:881 stop:1231 length:351 start_codon:yes stop_codon:yes gene_type:complete
MSKKLVNIFTNPMSGLIGSAIQRSGPGMVYGAANVATKAITGKTIPQHFVSSAQRPASADTQQRLARMQAKANRSVSPQKLEKLSSATASLSRGDFDRAQNSKGGVVSYKSVFDLE